MSNNKGLLITNNNIYGLVNPPPKPSYQDGATQAQNIASSAVRWDKFVDLSTNFYDWSKNFTGTGATGATGAIGATGPTGGLGSINTGEYNKVSNSFTVVASGITAQQDISGLYFDTKEFDISFNTVSGKKNIYVGLKPTLYDLSTNIWTSFDDLSANFYDLSTNFTDFSNNFIGGGGGSGTINTGEYDKDVNNNFTQVTTPARRDISGLYFDTNEFDISFNIDAGKENIYVGLKQNGGGNVNQDYINELFFDPPKAVTDDNIKLQTTTPPRLDASWNNPIQIRTAFDFLGNLGPIADDGALSTNNDESRDDYNFLPYFQGLKIQYLCYDGNSVVSGNDWTTVPVGSLSSLPTTSGVGYWNTGNSDNILPRFIRKVIIYANSSGATITNSSGGIVIFPDYSATATATPFDASDSSSYAFALPQHVPGSASVGTAGKKIQLRVAMINRARASITDPSYNTGHGLTSPDVSWNWVYIPDISGIALGNYGGPTAPLTFTTPTITSSSGKPRTLFHNEFTLSGQNDNSGNGTSPGQADEANAIVETGLFTPFSSLNNGPTVLINPSLPKVQYRYDLSGHRLSNSKQVDGNTTDIDLSRNLPDGLPSVWFPSTANSNGVPNTWTDSITRAERKVFPEHKYEIYGYSMRHSLDPSGLTVGFTDASSATVVASIPAWNTPVPPRSAATGTSTAGGYFDTLPNKLDTVASWKQSNDTSWNQTDYFVGGDVIKAFVNSKQIKTDLLFLNNGLDPSKNIATTIHSNSAYTIKIRANHDDLLGIDASGEEIIRMRSNIFIDGTATSHSTDLDLSGVQLGFQGTHDLSGGYSLGAKGTDVSNNFLGWKTSDIVNAFEKPGNTLIQEGGYYCGTELSGIDISNVNLTTYPDISNNSLQAGYKVIIYQELSSNLGWTRYPATAGGWHKIFNIATRPIEDIELFLTGTSFAIKDGYNGTNVHTPSNNKFKFGSTATTSSGPSKNFFGLPILANNSVDIINYVIKLENLDETWWPINNNLIGNLKLYFKGRTPTVIDPSQTFINWNSQIVDKSWFGRSNISGAFPKLPSSSNLIQTLTGDFDFNGTTPTSFGGNKYSRDLMDTGYTPSLATPLFFIEADYDNNILRNNRGVGTGLESGDRRSLNTACASTRINRFKGVGPLGNYKLFWDYTFNTSTLFQKTGNISSNAPYDKYPFVDVGGTADFTTSYDHTVTLSDGTTIFGGGDRQLIWAKDGFKPGGWSTGSENPYIDYSGNYWFGHHTSGFTPDYLNLNTIGEGLHVDARTYRDGSNSGKFAWWQDTNTLVQSSFIMNVNLKWKFIVIKCPIPAMTAPSGGFNGVSISMTTSTTSSPVLEIPCVDAMDLFAGPGNAKNPIVWLQEIGTSTTHPSSGFNQAGKSGWKATHKKFNPGQAQIVNNETNAGSLWLDDLTNGKIHRIWGVNTTVNAFNLYFRIGLPNQGTVDIQKINIQFKYVAPPPSGTTVSVVTNVTGTNSTQLFNFLN